MKYGSNGPNKACIWIKYNRYHLSTLLDTGSDVTIAGEDVAERMGWRIVEPRIKQVRVANNEAMCISGAVYADLTVGSRTVKSEILITPNRKGLILGSIGSASKVTFNGTSTRVEYDSAKRTGSNCVRKNVRFAESDLS